LSGEMLSGPHGFGLDSDALAGLAREISGAVSAGAQIGVVVGAGNIVRGAGPNATKLAVRKQPLDTMGMLATAINATALADTLRGCGLGGVHYSTLPGVPFSSPFDSDEADSLLRDGKVVVFSGGTGLPFFSTDTAAAVRALQIGAEALLKGTQVDGVFDRDPRKPGAEPARLLQTVSHRAVLEQGLQVMDPAAVALCAQSKLPIIVYNAHISGNLVGVLRGSVLASAIETL